MNKWPITLDFEQWKLGVQSEKKGPNCFHFLLDDQYASVFIDITIQTDPGKLFFDIDTANSSGHFDSVKQLAISNALADALKQHRQYWPG